VFILEAEYLFNPANAIAEFMAKSSRMSLPIIVGIINGSYGYRKK
jgi:hypothetical protein